MTRVLRILVTIIHWLQAFLCPVVVCGLVGILFGEKLIIPALIVGAIAGVALAEYIRRKIGLDVFFSRIYSANQMDKKTKGI